MPEKRISKFLRKLFGILDNDEYHSVISWDSDGERILIKDQLKMDVEIIPVYFSLRKFSSFVRQLHLYDFHKEKSTNSVLMFRNTFFKRDQRKLAESIIRKRKTKAQMQNASSTRTSTKSFDSQSVFVQLDETPLDCPGKKKQTHSLEMIALKSYSKLEDLGYDTHDIFNLMEIL